MTDANEFAVPVDDFDGIDAMEASAEAADAPAAAVVAAPNDANLLSGVNQYRATRLQVLNWGTFSGYHDVPIAKKGFLFVGASGSGKSTLLDAMVTLLFPSPDYNAAAREGDKRRGDRSLMSYLRGAWATQTESDEKGTRVATRYARTGSTFSAIALTLEDLTGVAVTLMMVVYVKGGSTEEAKVNRMYYVLPEAWSFDLRAFRDFAQFAQFDFKWLRRSLPNPQVFSKFSAYSDYFRGLFGIRDKSAMRLLAKAQSAKNLGDLNTFLRDFMLEEPGTFKIASDLAHEFDALDEAHRAVVRAREQEECLGAARTALKAASLERSRWESLAAQAAALPYWRISRDAALLEDEVRAASQRREAAQRAMEHAERAYALAAEDVNTLLKQSYEKGGAALERIKDQAGRAAERVREVEERRLLVAKHAAVLRPEFPKDENAWSALSQEARLALDDRERTVKARMEKRDALTEALRKAEEEFKARRREIQAMQARPSNIPSEYLDIRRSIAAAIDVPEDRLPFVGEWLEVKSEDAPWQGAIERVLRSFALSVMVPEDCADAFIETLEQRHLGLRLVYFRVPETKVRPTRPRTAKGRKSDLRATLPEKLNIRDGAFTTWLVNELAERFNYLCAADLDAFREAERAVTIHGQVRHNARRFEKDDRNRVDDRRNWVTGFSNTAKLALFEEEARTLAETIGSLTRERSALDDAVQEEASRQTAAEWVVSTRWEQIDVQAAKAALAALEAKLLQETEGNTELHRIEVELKFAQERMQQAQAQAFSARSEFDFAKRDFETAENALKIDRVRLENMGKEQPVPDEALLMLIETRALRGSTATLTRSMLPELAERAGRSLDAEKADAITKTNTAENAVVNRFSEYKRRWPGTGIDELDASLASAPQFMRMLEELEKDGLPQYESKFRELLDNQSLQNFTSLQSELRDGRRMIFDRIAIVNKSLESAPFNRTDDGGETHLRIDVKDRRHPEVADLNAKLDAILRTAWREATDAEVEERFRAVKALVARLNPENTQDERWRRTVLDVREHVEFLAVELDEDGNIVETYLSGAGKSGGQRQKLTTTCLAAALRYQLGESADGLPSFAPVILDEAFDKADSEFTDLSMSIFRRFGFQMIVATPEKAVYTLETFIGGAALITIRDRAWSGVLQIRYDEASAALDWTQIGPSGLTDAERAALAAKSTRRKAKASGNGSEASAETSEAASLFGDDAGGNA